VEPDVVDLYNALHGAIEPILKRYKIVERQWFMIWEHGYMYEWPIPKIEEEEKIRIVAAEVDKEPQPEEADPEKEAAEAKGNLKNLEGDFGLEDLGDVQLDAPPKPAPEAKKDKKEDEPEEPKLKKEKEYRSDWW
jgi:hypothetical protein